jgi:hypothetical protein
MMTFRSSAERIGGTESIRFNIVNINRHELILDNCPCTVVFFVHQSTFCEHIYIRTDFTYDPM